MRKHLLITLGITLACLFALVAVPALALEPPSDAEAAQLRNAPDLQQRIDRMNKLLDPLLHRPARQPLEVANDFATGLASNFGLRAGEQGFASGYDANNDQVIDERDFVEMAFQAPQLARHAAASPNHGQAKVCVIPIKFPDVSPSPSHDPAYWHEMLFGSGTYTTHSYYNVVSGGTLDLSGDVLTNPDEPDGYWVADNVKSYYNWDNDLLGEILAKVDPYYDFSQYDADHNGEADGVYFIYSGAVDGWGEFYWGWATYGSWMLDGVRVGPLMFVGEDLMTYRVAAHEFGHMMGLPDLYDYTFTSSGVGVFSLMGKGEAYLDAWNRSQLGWEHPAELGMDIYGAPFTPRSEGGHSYRLWDMGTHGSQFFLVELLSQTGYDYQLPASGIIIWHVDETRSNNNDWTHKLVDVEEADGLDDLDYAVNYGDEYDTYWPGNNVSFNHTTYPNSDAYSGAATAVQVMNVSTATADLLIGIAGDLPVNETEPNNTWNAAGVKTVPAPNGKFDGKVDINVDVSDFWRFTVAKPAVVDVTLTSDNKAVDLSLILYGLGGSGPIEIADTTSSDEHLRAYVFTPGNHYVEVRAKRQASYYNLLITQHFLPDPGFVEVGSAPLMPAKIYDNSMTIPALRMDFYNSAGTAALNSLTLYTEGTYPSCIQSVELWKDNGDDVFGPGLDTLVGGPVSPGLTNRIIIDNINTNVTNFTVLFVTIDTGDTAGGVQTGISVQSYKDIVLSKGSILYNNFPLDSGLATVSHAAMPLCYVAAGDFKMGTDPATDPYYNPACDLNEETPPHTNRTGDYYIGRYEITNAQFAQFMAGGGYTTKAYWTQSGWNWKNQNSVTHPDHWNDPLYPIGDAYPNYPVGGVSWYECYAYSNYIKGRLVREPEWEKAGRGTDARIYTYGNAYNAYIYSASGSEPVGSYPESDSLYGAADLEGNIFEWVSDSWEVGVYARYASGSFGEPPSSTYHMQRGYRYLVAGDCDTDYATRLSYRDTWPRTYRWTFLGFRVVFNPPT